MKNGYSENLYYIERVYCSKNTDDEIIIKGLVSPSKKHIKIIQNGNIIKEEKINMLNSEEQRNKLLDLGLKVHPLIRENPLERYCCWGIHASTKEKEEKRFNEIKKIFPKAIRTKLKHWSEGDFGVDLYGKL